MGRKLVVQVVLGLVTLVAVIAWSNIGQRIQYAKRTPRKQETPAQFEHRVALESWVIVPATATFVLPVCMLVLALTWHPQIKGDGPSPDLIDAVGRGR